MKDFNIWSIKKMGKNNSLGFTLIELVIVIVILGILSAVALPRFINLSSDANLSVYKYTYGSFKTAMNNQHLFWLAKGEPKNSDLINLNGKLDFNNLGYPAGIDDESQVSTPSDCLDIFKDIISTDLELAIPIGDGNGIKDLAKEVDIAVTHNANTCYYTFVSESKEVGYNARQFRYLYLSGDITEADYTLN